jgi:hypothetical protein
MSHWCMRMDHEPRAALTTRPGSAVVLALALVILGGVLLAGTSAASRAAVRSVETHEAAAVADTHWRLDAAQFLAAWSSAADSLPIGGEIRRLVGPTQVGLGGMTTTTAFRLVRLNAGRFLLSINTQVGPSNAVRARRRAAMILEARPVTDSTALLHAPVLPTTWAQYSLY